MAVTVKPSGAVGWAVPGQPTALDTLSVGIKEVLGSGNCGAGPTPAWNGSLDDSPQAVRTAAADIKSARRLGTFMVETSGQNPDGVLRDGAWVNTGGGAIDY